MHFPVICRWFGHKFIFRMEFMGTCTGRVQYMQSDRCIRCGFKPE